jgi:hypothetical protein
MRNSKRIFSVFVLLALSIMGVSVRAQRRPSRVTDRQVSGILQRLEQSSSRFRGSLNDALGRARIDETRPQNDINSFEPGFASATNQFRNQYTRRLAVAADVENAVMTNAAQTRARLVPITLRNKDGRLLHAKLIGPVTKTVTLDYGTRVLIYLIPGNYRFFYQFEDQKDHTFRYSASPEFTITDKDEYFLVEADPDEIMFPPPELQNRDKEITATVFNEAGQSTAPVAMGSGSQAYPGGQWDTVRFGEIDVVASIGDLYGADAPRAYSAVSRTVSVYLNRYIGEYLLPKLRKQGFKVTYLGIRTEPDTFSRATLLVLYNEQQGKPYTVDYQRTDYGVDIDCTLSLRNPRIRTQAPVWEQVLHVSTSDEVKASLLNPTSAFRQASLIVLRHEFEGLRIYLDDWRPR